VRAARKAPAREPEPERASEPAAPLWGQGQPTGPRYMAPVAGGPAAAAVVAPQRLSPHLPAQAYRGPSGGFWQNQR
jgi:hypothetical protein